MARIFLFGIFLIQNLAAQQIQGRLTFQQADFIKELIFGIDLTATDYIDNHLNEYEAPPMPPSDAKEARFVGETIGLGLYRDFRLNAENSKIKIHKIKLQVNPNDSLFVWSDIPQNVVAYLKDPINGKFINIELKNNVKAVLPNFAFFSELILEVDYRGVMLPVELISFKVEIQNTFAILKWSTSSEINNYGFEVQRKKIGDKSDYVNISFLSGKNNSNVKREYFFVDKNLSNGTYIYRLKQIDCDGNFSFYESYPIEIKNQTPLIIDAYPNPFNFATTIKFSASDKVIDKIDLYDSNGRKIRTILENFILDGNKDIRLNLDGLASGFYYLRAEIEGERIVKKICLSK